VTVFRGVDQSGPDGSELGQRAVATYEQARRPASSRRLGLGTLACGRCDAPIAIGADPLLLTDELTCPFCHDRGPVRDFLSLAYPTRPARVVLHVRLPERVG